MTEELMSFHEAAAKGISRLRQSQWRTPTDHITIVIKDGKMHGLWCKFYSTMNKAFNQRDPVELMVMRDLEGAVDPTERKWLAYTGITADSDEYQRLAKEFTDGWEALEYRSTKALQKDPGGVG